MLRNKPKPAPTTTKQTPPTSLPPFLPLQHYLSRLPLQNGAILFCLIKSNTPFPAPTPATFLSLLTPLIDDPVKTLAMTCAGVSFVQAWYGSWAKSTRKNALGLGYKGPKTRKEKVGFFGAFSKMKDDLMSGRAPTVGEKPEGLDLDFSYLGVASIVTLAGAFVFHAGAILLGAPLITKSPETFLLSLLVSLLAVTPLAIAIPPMDESKVWIRLFSSLSTSNDLELVLLVPALGAIIGCWLGALPIPLDWDRPWQAWPTTSVIGTIGGHAIGSVVAMGVTTYKEF